MRLSFSLHITKITSGRGMTEAELGIAKPFPVVLARLVVHPEDGVTTKLEARAQSKQPVAIVFDSEREGFTTDL